MPSIELNTVTVPMLTGKKEATGGALASASRDPALRGGRSRVDRGTTAFESHREWGAL